ncbi:indole-3-glycerol phosphate synthase TrpC [soil metagenome]
MTDFLHTMRAASEARLTRARQEVPASLLLEQALATPAPPQLGLDKRRFEVIAEFKRRSPAAGILESAARRLDIAAVVRTYAEAGAAVVSVLTEPERFGGSLQDLRVAADALRPFGVPAMRKDFLIDPYQVCEARAHGAGGVLVILALVEDPQLARILEIAFRLELFVLLEAFNTGELERAARIVSMHGSARSLLVGLNARNLHTLEVDAGRLTGLAFHLPAGAPAVAESGIRDGPDAARAAAAGYSLALVGSALMLSADPGRLLRSLLLHGRKARGERAKAAGS